MQWKAELPIIKSQKRREFIRTCIANALLQADQLLREQGDALAK